MFDLAIMFNPNDNDYYFSKGIFYVDNRIIISLIIKLFKSNSYVRWSYWNLIKYRLVLLSQGYHY